MYFTVAQIKQANKQAGKHFFDPATMRWWDSRVLKRVYHGRYFITSERPFRDMPRLYTVRECTETGDILTVQEQVSLKEARKVVKSLQ